LQGAGLGLGALAPAVLVAFHTVLKGGVVHATRLGLLDAQANVVGFFGGVAAAAGHGQRKSHEANVTVDHHAVP
jgi:hypothetical protein